MVLSLGAVVVALTVASAIPALGQTSEGGNGGLVAQVDDKAAKKAARQAARQEQKAAKQAQKSQSSSAPQAQDTAQKKQLPATGGPLAANVAFLGLGAGTLVVGGGLALVGRRR
jgi:hypothetical protein